jgi:hypothetical protein
MSSPNNFDRDVFQSLLANAFSVQRSGMNPQTLSAFVAIQNLISTDDFDSEKVMSCIADSAREVANATGIGIALLQGNQLVYRAGSGSTSKNIGRHLTAVLSASTHGQPHREILRVEDASTDFRIEAEICRQFDAMALLLMPIYREHAVIGVFEVLFNAPHKFADCEVRTYHLMATLVADATSPAVQPASDEVVDPILAADDLWMRSAEIQQLGLLSEPLPQPEPRPGLASVYEQVSSSLRKLRKRYYPISAVTGAWQRLLISTIQENSAATTKSWLPRFRPGKSGLTVSPASLIALLPKLRLNMPRWRVSRIVVRQSSWRLSSARFRWSWDLAAIPLVLALAVAAAIARHHTNVLPVAGSQNADSKTAPASSLPMDESATTQLVQSQSGMGTRNPVPSSAFKRVWVGRDEVDDVADDVTIRHFRNGPSAVPARIWKKQVNIGNDVTVRYFDAPSLPAPQSTPASARSVSD